MKKLAIVTLLSTVPFSAFAEEDSKQKLSPSQHDVITHRIAATTSEQHFTQRLLSTKEITDKLAKQIAQSPEMADTFVAEVLKANPGLAKIDMNPSLVVSVIKTAITAAPEQSKNIVARAVTVQPSDSANIIKSAIETNPSATSEIVNAGIQASPENAATIVQAAVEANPNEYERIIAIAIENGVDKDEAIIAAIIGGADESLFANKQKKNSDEYLIAFAPTPKTDGFSGGTGSSTDENVRIEQQVTEPAGTSEKDTLNTQDTPEYSGVGAGPGSGSDQIASLN